jgi:hypothetical protein
MGGVQIMNIELTEKQYRYLLDLVYIGNWVMNSTRENDRIREYDEMESLIFSHCPHHGMKKLAERLDGEIIPPARSPTAAFTRSLRITRM